MQQMARLPTRKELALRPLYIIVESAALGIAWIELLRRVCLSAMGTVIYALIGAIFGLLIGYGWGWARAMREAEAMRALLAHKAAGPIVSDARLGDV